MTNTSIDANNKQHTRNQKIETIQNLKRALVKEANDRGCVVNSVEELVDYDITNKNFGQSDLSIFVELQEKGKKLLEEKQIENPANELLKEEQELSLEVVIDELNKKHAVVHTDRFYILTEKEDPHQGGFNFTLESKQSFKDMYENQLVQLPSGKKSSKAEIWLKAKRRRQYEGIIFNPNLEKEDPKYFNIWKGFAVPPKKGCCEKYKAHVRDIICKGNPVYFDFLWKWCARLVQKPDKLAEVAIVLLGKPGTGKNTFVEPLGKIFGVHYLLLDNIDQLLGKFNFHLKNAVLIHGNEALWGGNRKEGGKLKATITESNKVIEGKGKDTIVVPNFTHLILSSNEDWPVHIDGDDRRFFVLKVSDKHQEDKVYFKAIDDELKNGGLEALLYELLEEDISNFNHRDFPRTDEAFGIKLMSASSCDRYIFEALKVGCFDLGNTTPLESWSTEKKKDSVHIDYTIWCKKEGETQLNSETLGRRLRKLIPSTETIRTRQKTIRLWCYKFPELSQARIQFENAYKVSPSVWDQ